MLVFVRTKTACAELSQKLEARGYAASFLNGDVPQKKRERTIEWFKSGRFDILVATDVAARGLDVERISHVINYDIPYDTEAYIHRIGRTGRAGRSGEAILFVTPRERRMLIAIERATNQKINMMQMPSTEDINNKRIADFKQRISDTLATEELGLYYQIVEQYRQEHNVPALNIASALAKLVQGDEPMLLEKNSVRKKHSQITGRDALTAPEPGMERFRIEVGSDHGVKPGNIVGAIANEAGIDSQYIGKIDICNDYSTVELPQGMPREIFRGLKKVWVAGLQLKISRVHDAEGKTKKGKRRVGIRDSASVKTKGSKNVRRKRAKSKKKF
jgi:ATP-dependent RNA helicase DeaD